jgi:hypothetical protein
MTNTTGTREVIAYAADHIRITGVAKGPDSGWSFDGTTLSHPMKIRLHLTAEAAARIAQAVGAAVPASCSRLSGAQVSQLPEAEREGYEWDRDMDAMVGMYQKFTDPVPGRAEFDVSEVTSVSRG